MVCACTLLPLQYISGLFFSCVRPSVRFFYHFRYCYTRKIGLEMMLFVPWPYFCVYFMGLLPMLWLCLINHTLIAHNNWWCYVWIIISFWTLGWGCGMLTCLCEPTLFSCSALQFGSNKVFLYNRPIIKCVIMVLISSVEIILIEVLSNYVVANWKCHLFYVASTSSLVVWM